MLKLAKYLKPFTISVIAALVLLFAQAMFDLSLPNYMSDIVNTGIQKGGITEIAPKAISETGMSLMQKFMNDTDKAAVIAAYVPINDANGDVHADAINIYPKAEEQNAYVLTSPSAEADNAFARASYALIELVKQFQSDGSHTTGDNAQTTIDISKMEQLLPMLEQMPQEKIDEIINTAASAADMIVQQTGAVFVKSFYTQLGADTDAIQTNYIFLTGLKMLGMSLLITICSVGVGFFASRLGAGVAKNLRHDVFQKVTSFTSAEMDKFSTASLITRTTNDVTQIQGFLTMGLRILCFAPIMGIGGAIMALNKSTSMSWIIALAVIILIGVIGTIFAIAMPKFTKMQTLVDRLNLVSRENLSGMMVIRAFNTQKFEEDRFDKANVDLVKNTQFVFRTVTFMMPIMTIIMNAVTLLIVWVGGKQIAASTMQVGDMMAFMQYAMQIIMSFLMISMMFIMLPRASVSGKRIHEVLSSESSVRDAQVPKTLGNKVKGEVEFKDVSFKYYGADEPVLENISFTANAGETTAFIGSTGSGKSTLINLVPRFYDVTSGSVKIDGVDVRDISQHELRNKIGYVPQKAILFSGTVATNMRLGDENASQQVLSDAAATAQAAEFIEKLENGYEYEISQGGTNVSGGQRQRLAIARALVKKAPIYIFDDTFSALDFKTDAALRGALAGYTGGATVFIVAQRISTIVNADKIVVLDEGKIAGIGTHTQLMDNCQPYREIAFSQLPKEELQAWLK